MRIAVVGDSFVFGVVPRETLFTTVLEELASKRGTHLEVMNMGIAAAGPKNYVGLIRHDVAQSNAHIVAVMLFVGNDIVQAHPHFKTSLWLNSTREMLEQPYYVGWSPEYSYLYRSLRYVLRFVREARDDSPRESFTRDTYLAIQKQRTLIYRRELNTFARSGYESIVELVAAMSAEAARQDRQFFVILAPDEVQTNPDIRRQLIDVYDLDAAAYHFDQPQAMLGTALRARGIRVVDLLPEFRRLNQTMPLYIEHDTHWNRQGNRLAAQLIWRHLQAQELPALEN